MRGECGDLCGGYVRSDLVRERNPTADVLVRGFQFITMLERAECLVFKIEEKNKE